MALLPPQYLDKVFQFHWLALQPKKKKKKRGEWAIGKPIKIGLGLINLLEHRIKKICTNR